MWSAPAPNFKVQLNASDGDSDKQHVCMEMNLLSISVDILYIVSHVLFLFFSAPVRDRICCFFGQTLKKGRFCEVRTNFNKMMETQTVRLSSGKWHTNYPILRWCWAFNHEPVFCFVLFCGFFFVFGVFFLLTSTLLSQVNFIVISDIWDTIKYWNDLPQRPTQQFNKKCKQNVQMHTKQQL